MCVAVAAKGGNTERSFIQAVMQLRVIVSTEISVKLN